VRLLMIGALHAVRVPAEEEEALRDLVRAREDLRGDLMRARHRLSKFLLRHDVRFDDSASRWGQRHRQWLARIELAAPGAQLTLSDYVGAIDALAIGRDTLEAAIAQLIVSSPWANTVARLRCLRGIDTLTAAGLCAEIGTFERFEQPRQLMSYLGLVPSEHSSGQTRRQAAITRSGSQHARRLLVEAARHYRRAPRIGTQLERRQHDQDPAVIAIAWKAQQRLHRVWRRLELKRGTRTTIIATAVARQLAGFCKGARHPQRSPQLTEHRPHDTRLRRRRNPPGHHAREHPRCVHEHHHHGGHARHKPAGSHDEHGPAVPNPRT
jgi:transposase